MSSLEDFESWIKLQGGQEALVSRFKAEFGEKAEISQGAISNWIRRRRIPLGVQRDRLKVVGWGGPYEWPADEVTRRSPGQYAAAAWTIIREAAVNTETDLTAAPIAGIVEELFDSIADAAAQGRFEEARQRLIRKAEVTFQAVKK